MRLTATSTSTELLGSASKLRARMVPNGPCGRCMISLDGYADDEGKSRGVLGVSLENTGVTAIFDPMIERAGGLLPTNGLAMGEEHQDKTHGAHCNNTERVMFWQNEGVEGLSSVLGRTLANGRVSCSTTPAWPTPMPSVEPACSWDIRARLRARGRPA